MKLDVDTLSTVPDAPPAAGPDRALDPEGDVAVAEGDVAVAEGDVAQPAESPITAHISAAAAIRPLLLFDSNRRCPARRSCSAMVIEAHEFDEDADGGGPEVALETGQTGTVSRGLVG